MTRMTPEDIAIHKSLNWKLLGQEWKSPSKRQDIAEYALGVTMIRTSRKSHSGCDRFSHEFFASRGL